MSHQPLIRCEGVHKSFRMGAEQIHILRGADLSVKPGEFVAIEGRSGSGKSTLLHLIAGLDAPDAGDIFIDSEVVSQLSTTPIGDGALSRLRNARIGFVFQFYHLLPELNVLQNTTLARSIKESVLSYRVNKREIEAKAADILNTLGLSHRIHHRSNQLSGGERQRVAIARALMNDPAVLLADEPTGNLDHETGKSIMAVLENLHQTRKQTIVMVTHDRSLAGRADRSLLLRDGKLVAVSGAAEVARA
jgi:lipoprotein-releasing system ATP-binding protein